MFPRRYRSALSIVFAVAALSLGACASTNQAAAPQPVEAIDEPNDPLESVNRVVFDVNIALDDYLLKPVAKGYRDYTPQPVRKAISNVLSNLSFPIRLANDTLQGNGERAGQTFGRFWVNTFLGLGGMIDVGTAIGIPYHDSDFGQTLGAWGMGPGPYIMLPLLGPSDPRDAIGFGVDSVADPFTIKMNAAGMAEGTYVRTGVGIVDSRSQNIDELDELRRGSLDFYAAVRSLYQQKRAADVRAATGKTQPSISYDLDNGDKLDDAAQTPPPVTAQKAY
jgi:phospholipid-binding lipoprotein MlaA